MSSRLTVLSFLPVVVVVVVVVLELRSFRRNSDAEARGVVSQTGSGRFPVVNKEARRSGSRREHEAVVPVNLMC